MAKYTNIDKGPRGLNTTQGKVWADPGETVDVELAKGEAAPKDWFKSEGKATKVDEGGEPKTAAEVLALADGNFMAFKSAATKLLGGKAPGPQAENVAALEDLGA
jgi:hypothetical protein